MSSRARFGAVAPPLTGRGDATVSAGRAGSSRGRCPRCRGHGIGPGGQAGDEDDPDRHGSGWRSRRKRARDQPGATWRSRACLPSATQSPKPSRSSRKLSRVAAWIDPTNPGQTLADKQLDAAAKILSGAPVRVQHHAQDAVDAEPGVPEARVGVPHAPYCELLRFEPPRTARTRRALLMSLLFRTDTKPLRKFTKYANVGAKLGWSAEVVDDQ
jgi:hypothetical protein